MRLCCVSSTRELRRMAAKRRASGTVGPRGPRGLTGRQGKQGQSGPQGKQGPPGPPNGELKRLSSQVAEIVKELQTQLTRIAQIQAQLDRLATGQSPERRD